MHYLHRVLVHLPSAGLDYKNNDRDELIHAVRSHAETETENYYGRAYDWRETSTAGRWSSVYPENVIFAADDLDRFIEELDDCLAAQKREVYSNLSRLNETVGTDLGKIVDGVLALEDYSDNKDGFDFMTPYYLHEISSRLHGDYPYGYLQGEVYYTHEELTLDEDKKPYPWEKQVDEYHDSVNDNTVIVVVDCHI